MGEIKPDVVPEWVAPSRYATMRHVSAATIFKAADQGRLRIVDGKVNIAEADATWYRRYLQRQDGRRSGAENEARREEALTQSTGAKIIMTRRAVERMRDALVVRDQHQAEIGEAANAVREELARATGLKSRRIVEAIKDDLGDLQAEALRVTQ